MLIVKSPFRMSLFGGSTDYEDFYKNHGSFIIGTTIDKYAYLTGRTKPSILPRENHISYSKTEVAKRISDIENPLIRETLKFYDIDCCIDFKCFSDIPFRTGLGGSSTFCVGLAYIANKLNNNKIDRKRLAQDAIHIERVVLKESGGIQDQIWASYGGFNTIEIGRHGDFTVKPLAISREFKKELEDSFVLIYTDQQREEDAIAKSHENVDKRDILDLAHDAHDAFLSEDIAGIGEYLYTSWKLKSKISNLISTERIDDIITDVMDMGAYGAKLLGGGGCGFIAAMCSPDVKKTVIAKYKGAVMEIKFDNDGVSEIYNGI